MYSEAGSSRNMGCGGQSVIREENTKIPTGEMASVNLLKLSGKSEKYPETTFRDSR